MKNFKLLNLLDSIAIFALTIMLVLAFEDQFTDHDLPCALCVMLRMGLYAMSYGLILNLTQARKQTHYLHVILAATIEIIIAAEFVVRHIVPGSGHYGDTIFGLHMYTWSLIASTIVLIYATIAGLINGTTIQVAAKNNWVKYIIGFMLLTLCANIISTAMECGPYSCPSDPSNYWLISKIHTYITHP